MARDYELGIVLNPEVGDEQARATVERVTQLVAAHDGQVVRVNAWGRRRLAYPIEHHRDGLYFFFDLILPPQSIVEVERALHLNEEIMRHLILVRDPRMAAEQRQRDAEADARAAEARAQAEAEALAQAEAQAAEAQQAEAEEAAAPVAEAAEAETAEAASAGAASAGAASAGGEAEAETAEAPQEDTGEPEAPTSADTVETEA
jgi:small subunit ribosomal protein S6